MDTLSVINRALCTWDMNKNCREKISLFTLRRRLRNLHFYKHIFYTGKIGFGITLCVFLLRTIFLRIVFFIPFHLYWICRNFKQAYCIVYAEETPKRIHMKGKQTKKRYVSTLWHYWASSFCCEKIEWMSCACEHPQNISRVTESVEAHTSCFTDIGWNASE